jgi:hypothetical protein
MKLDFLYTRATCSKSAGTSEGDGDASIRAGFGVSGHGGCFGDRWGPRHNQPQHDTGGKARVGVARCAWSPGVPSTSPLHRGRKPEEIIVSPVSPVSRCPCIDGTNPSDVDGFDQKLSMNGPGQLSRRQLVVGRSSGGVVTAASA